MGIDLELPLNLGASAPSTSTLKAVPNSMYSIWVGDKPIPDDILKNLERNACIATGSYRSKLYLSDRNPAAFASNKRNLGLLAPHVEPITLENSFFGNRSIELDQKKREVACVY